MKYSLHIPFAGRVDFLFDAVESVRDIGHIHIWSTGDLPNEPLNVDIHRLPPMPYTAVHNMIFERSWDDDVAFVMHVDGLAKPGVAERLLWFVEEVHNAGSRWGTIFTNYDVLAAYNMRAVRLVGFYDPMFYAYVADNDYQRRMLLAGWVPIEAEEFRDGVIHREGGNGTVKGDPTLDYVLKWRAATHFDFGYYELKWGGPIYREKFKTPFDRRPVWTSEGVAAMLAAAGREEARRWRQLV